MQILKKSFNPVIQHTLIGFSLISLFWWPLISGSGFIYFADTITEYFPLQSFLKSSWLSGQSITWNPYIGLGAPSLAEGHMGAFSAGNWLHFIFNSWPHSLVWVYLLHLILGWVGTGAVSRKLGVSFEGQILSSLLFILGGYVTAFSTNHVYILAVCQIPWVILAAYHFGEKPCFYRALILSALMSIHLFTGAYPVVFISSLSVLVVSVVATFQNKNFLLRYFSWFSFSTVAAILLSLAQLLPTIELIFNSIFSKGRGFEYITSNSLDGNMLLSFLFPHIWGFVQSGSSFPAFETAEYLQQGYFDYDELHNYVGLIAFQLLALGLIFYVKKTWLSKLRPFLVLGLVALILSLGSSIPGVYQVLQYVPVFNFFKDPAKWSVAFNLSIALLVGFFWDQFKEDSKSKSKYLWVTGFLILTGMYFYFSKDNFPQLFRSHTYPMCQSNLSIWGCFIIEKTTPFIFFVLALISSGLLLFKKRRFIYIFILGFVFLDLWFVERTVYPLAQAEFYQRQPDQISNLQNDLDYRVMNGLVEESAALDPAYSIGEMSAHWKYMGTTVTTPLILNSLETVFQVTNQNGFFELASRTHKTDFSENFLDAIGVKYLLEQGPGSPSKSQVIVRENPRKTFYLTQDVEYNDKYIDARTEFLNRCQNQPYCGPSIIYDKNTITPTHPFEGEVIKSSQTNTELILKTDTNATSLLVWTDMNYPGWNVEIDGTPTHLTLVNGMFKGVIVPEGTHTVRFWFHSLTATWGKWISSFSWLLWLMTILVGYRNKKFLKKTNSL